MVLKKFESVPLRDAYLDREFPTRKASEYPGLYTVPGSSLVIKVWMRTVEVIQTEIAEDYD